MKYSNLINPITVFILMSLLLFSGCSISKEKKVSTAEKNDTYIDINNVEWITRTGGLPGGRGKVLFPQKDIEKIRKLILLINSGTGMRYATKEEIDSTSYGYQSPITIKLKDRRMVYIWHIKEVTLKKFPDGSGELTGKPLKDRFLLEIKEGKEDKRYTLFSNEAAEYILVEADKDIPRVREFTIKPEKELYRIGDEVTIYGDGIVDKEVKINLVDGSNKEKYQVGRVMPNFGEWKWEFTISRKIKTVDGNDITLKNGKYHFEIEGIATLGAAIDISE